MKKRLKRLLSAFMVVCMIAAFAPTAFATSGSDIDGHWAQTTMQKFIDSGWLNGYGNGKYGPNDSMTRAQYAALLNRVAGLTEESDRINNYTDVSSSDWYYSDMAKALAAGYMQGKSATTLCPNDTITRQEAFVMVANLLGLKATDSDISALSQFSDSSDISDWAKNAAAALVAAGYIKGSDGKIQPTSNMTRAEGVTMIDRSSDELQKVEVKKNDLIDGVYTGTGAGYGGTLTLQMTVSGGKITAIEILDNGETAAFLNRAKSIITSVLDKQSTDGIDTVSGATLSSNAILTAIEACISQAKGGEDTSKKGSTGSISSSGNVGNSTETEGEDFSRLADGDYEGSAAGYSGTTKVKVTVSGGKITNVEILSHGDTDSYFNSAKSVITKVVDNQSTDVDTVSGATYSSYGILNAINNALKDAESSDSLTIEVASWAEFTKALAAAKDGDTIKLTADINDAGEDYTTLTKEDGSTYGSVIDAVSSATLGMATISKTITIDGDGKTISAGENKAFCFNISGSGVVIENLTIDGASYGARMGGGIYLAGGHGSTEAPSLTMNKVTVKNCASYKESMPGNGGGAIYAKGNVTLTATNCTFETNSVVNAGFGGAVYAQGSTVTLTDCIFTGNSAKYGGAVAASGTATISVTGCTFTGNTADNGGNDVYIFDGKTPTKSNQYSDSAVTFVLSGNTYQDDSKAANFKDYSVILGRYVVDETAETNGKNYSGNPDSIIQDGHDVTFTDANRTEVSTENETAYVTLWMNIPYGEFYSADINNDTTVDAVSSATKSKTIGTLASGSYHAVNDGSEITGVIFPVIMTSEDFETLQTKGYTVIDDTSSVSITTTNRGQTSTATYNGKDALFQSGDYSYYVVTDGTKTTFPTYYKIASYSDGTLTFGKTQGVATTLSGVSATFMTDTSYGDYQLNLVGIDAFSYDNNDTISAVVIHTKEGNDYGLRHMENIWRGTQLAWSTGFTTTTHGCQLSYNHYVSMMGQTITSVTYYTSNGIFEIPLDEIYVPVKFNSNLSVADASVSAKSTTITSTFPVGYNAKITIANAKNDDVTDEFTIVGNTIKWDSTIKQGAYTLTVSDENGVYISCSTTFTLSVSENPVVYDGETLSLKAAEGKSNEDLEDYLASIESVEVNSTSYSATGKGAVTVINSNGFIDLNAKSQAMGGAASYVFGNTLEAGTEFTVTVTATGYSAPLTFKVTIPDTVYAYATLTYAEYWAAESINVSGDDLTASSGEKDSNNESDTGAFDAVSRATSNHGLHRGSFQQSVTIKTKTEKTYSPMYWIDGDNFVDADGNTYNKKEIGIDSYEITGIKYVPVAISVSDYRDFCNEYTVTQNGETMQGGYSEQNLTAYTNLVACVTKDTNGLKTATHNDNVWSFGKRATGTDSGILGQELATASNVEASVKDSSKFGDFLRVDITGTGYGALGDMMQTVVWTYYGNDSTYTTALATYGTKFASDNWMHKSMGIQLGLTDSLRCQLPEGTYGTGYWTVTVYALGYEDYTAQVKVEASDLHGTKSLMTEEQKASLETLASSAGTLLESYNADTASDAEKTLKEHYDEAVALLGNEEATSAEAEELITELTELIKNVSNS